MRRELDLDLSNGIKGAIAVVVALIVIAIGMFMCTTRINPGYAGVVYSMNGGLQDTTLSQGYKFLPPWKSVQEYPVSTETVYLSKDPKEGPKEDHSVDVSTVEGKLVNVDLYYTYHMNPSKLPLVFNRFKGANIGIIEDGYLKQQVKNSTQAVTSTYSVMDVYGNKRDEIQKKVQVGLKMELEPFGIEIETFAFGGIRPDDDTKKAIQAKVDAQQKLQQMEIELQQSTIAANKLKVEAQGIADATIIRATAETESNRLIQSSLTPELLQKMWINQWDGKQSQVVGGSNMISIPLPAVAAK